MEVIKYIFIRLLLILLSVEYIVSNDELIDFEFDTPTDINTNTEIDSEYYYMDEMSSPAPFSLNPDRIDNDFDLLDDEFTSIDNQQSDFIVKEKNLRDILLKAMSSYEMKRKFAQVLPILRVMSSTQRVALAALISAQISAKPGKELNLEQVQQMFGNRPDLILPLVLDIANLVRLASIQEVKTDAISEQEPIQSNQLLRRSFQTRTKKSTQENNYSINTSMEMAPVSNLNDDSLSVEDSDSELITTVHSDLKSPERLDQIQALPLVRVDPFNPFQKLTDNNDKRTFHERILNMTLYRGLTDQLAMPSDGVPLQITLPRAPPQVYQQANNLTLEQIEDLAFAGINGTDNININSTNGENLPEPEMLIGGRYRVKGISYSTVRHKDLKTNTAGSCQRFTGTICLHSDDYPMEQIMGSIRRHKHAISALLAEYKDKSNDDDYDYEDNSQRYNKRRREDSSEQTPSSGGMCQSIIRYARPQKARSASGDWKFIVNTGQHTQTLRLEKCNNPQDSCTYLTDNFKSRCVQIFNYHRLLSWDKSRGLHVDIFKVPTCCSCHIDGYRESFPPLASPSNSFVSSTNNNGKYQQFDINEYRPHNTVQRIPQYSTINEKDLDDEEEEDDDEEAVSYQFSNGFKLNPYKYETSGLLQSSSNQKNKFDRSKPSKINYSLNPTLGTYLSPPSNEYDTYNFLNHNAEIVTGTAKRGRRPVRRDQSISASEMKPNKIPLSQIILTTKRPRKRLQSINDDKLKYVTSPGQDEFQAKRIIAKLPKAPTTMQTVTVSSSGYPTTVDFKRVNYNYHPIIDFFEEDNDKEDRKGVPREKQNSWRPMIVPQPRRH